MEFHDTTAVMQHIRDCRDEGYPNGHGRQPQRHKKSIDLLHFIEMLKEEAAVSMNVRKSPWLARNEDVTTSFNECRSL